jgi:uncharacterized protein (TIGR00299 family) protein
VSSRVVYFDLASGSGGDMLIAALVHAGRSEGVDVSGVVAEAVSGLGLGCDIAFANVDEGGLAALHAGVTTDGSRVAPSQMTDAIARTAASGRAKAAAAAVISLLVGAEARVHGAEPADVHLHELGSADTVADAIGAAVALEALQIDFVTAAAVPMPRGWIVANHGPLPLPAPATLEVLRGKQIVGVDASGELVTPTAAAILVAHDCAFGALPRMTLDSVGMGVGSRRREVPNICRALVGLRVPGVEGIATENVVALETNIDDQTPEGLGYAIERLIGAGALDAWVTPIVMKKSRSAFQLSVLTHSADEARILDVLFRETTTLGVRRRETQRWVLERDEIVVDVAGRCVRVKVALLRGDVVGATPEFDDCVRASKESGAAVKDVYTAAAEAARVALRTP